MRHPELVQALRSQPFRPFRIHVSDGAEYDVRHPDVVLVTPMYAIVGAPMEDEQPPLVERHDIVDLAHITRIQPIESSTAS